MPDIIITPSIGKLEFVDNSAQTTRRHSFTLDHSDGLVLDAPLSAAAISAPLNVINVTVNNNNVNYPIILASGSAEVNAKTLIMDGAGGTYNPFTNTATIDISGNAATATNATQLNGQADSFYTNIPARLGYTPVNKAGDTVTGNLVINGNFTVTGTTTLFSASNVYISSSQLVIDDNIITLNAFSPFLRYAGIEMIDSGSATTSSILWDSQNDYFFLTGSGVNGKIITGPDTQGSLTSGKIVKATGTNIIGDSIISDNGSAISIAGTISANNLSGTNTGDQTVGDATLTVGAGTGISLSASPTFTANATSAKTITITNSGVTAITTNTGLSTNASATGAVTITNTGVTSNVAGTGISVSGATGAVTITNSGVTSAVAGTGVGVSAATGAVTFSIGQAVGTGNIPTFAGANLNGQLQVNHTTPTSILRIYSGGSTAWTVGVGDTSGTYFNISADFGSVLINKSTGNIWISGSGINNTVLHSGTTSAPNLSIGGNAATATAANAISFTEVELNAPVTVSGTWNTGNGSQWGEPKFGTSFNQYRYADGNGPYVEYNIPANHHACFISQLQWDTGGYADCHGVQSDGDLVFLRRINTRQLVENSDHGNTIQHDGATVTFVGSGLQAFSKIRITNRSGRIHMTGIAFTRQIDDGYEGTGMVHPAQISHQGAGSGLDADLLDGYSSATANTANTIVLRDASGNFSAGTITATLSGNASTVTNGFYTTGGQTIAGITYFSNTESINLYGIRGRFTNEYIHLYNKVGVGHPGGWGQGESSTPNQGLSTYGGITVAYGTNATSIFYGNVGIGTTVVNARVESYYSSNAITFNYLATNLNNNSPIPVYGFDVTNGSGETRSIKAGIGYERHLTNGRGTLHFYNDSTNDTASLTGNRTTAGDIKMSLDNSGNLGIGTTTPATKLDVYGPVSLRGTTVLTTNFDLNAGNANDIYGNIRVLRGASLNDGMYIGYGGAGGNLKFFSNSGTTEFMTVATTGNVGIGSTNPAALLNIRASVPSGTISAIAGTNLQIDSNTSSYISFINTADNGTYAGLVFTDNNNGGYIVFRNYTGDVTNGSDSLIYGTYQDHIFQTGTTAGVNSRNEAMRIKNSGNVGIGSNNPQYKLDVNGTFNATGTSTLAGVSITGTINSSATEAVRVNNNSGYISIYNSAGTTRTGYIQGLTGGSLTLSAENGALLQFLVGGTERLRIDTSGNVGIGTTSPSSRVHIYENANRVTYITQNNNHTARFEAYGTATAIDTTASNGIFFRINGGDIVKFAANGYVGINTNNPTARLQVVQGNSGGVAAILLSSDESTIQGPSANTQIRMGSNLVLNASGIIPIGTNGSERVRIDSSGNVGVGTTAPGQKLDVEGRIRTRGASGSGGFEIGAATTGAAKWRIEWDSASDSLDFNWVG